MPAPAPSEIRLSKDKRWLKIGYDGGKSHELSAELLRVESPSAEVQGHDKSQKNIIPGKRDVTIIQIEPVGNYAVRLTFDDMHDTGIFSWEILHRFCNEGDELLGAYFAALEEKGLSR